ncbi:ABC transporter substrate-binding protein [Massilia sp. CMS3.1]|uniref:ABC transporter substrate-binding protein n=1 Tax=Massilia sp. CMS3.1 TaxID=3373083 RepID=UPI003EE512C5
MRKPIILSLIWAAIGVSAPAHAGVELGASSNQAHVSIGCMYPLAGRAAIYGRDSIAAMRLALADLRTALAPHPVPKLRILVEDDRSKNSVALRIADDFVTHKKVKFLCGVVSSGVAQAVSRFAKRRKVIFIGTDNASSRLTMEDWHRYYFRVTNDTWISMAAGARYLSDLQAEKKWARLAYIGPDYELGHAAWVDFAESLKRQGVQYTMTVQLWPRLYEPDYTAYIQQLVAAKPDVVVTTLWGGDFIAFVKQANVAGLLEKSIIANFDSGANYDFLSTFGDYSPKNLVLSARHLNNWPDTPANRRFVEAFHRTEGRYPTYAAAGAYAGVMAIARAVSLAGASADTERLVGTLEGLRVPLPKDPEGFISYIDPKTHQIVQSQAVGELVPDLRYPPARVAVGRFRAYAAEDLKPPLDLVKRRWENAYFRSKELPNTAVSKSVAAPLHLPKP